MNLDNFIRDAVYFQPDLTQLSIAAKTREEFYINDCLKCLQTIFPNGIIFAKK